jgi:phage shock protein E
VRIKHGLLLSVLVIISIVTTALLSLHFSVFGFSSEISTRNAYENIFLEKAKWMIDSGQNIILLDVRTPAEYESGHIPGASLYPLQELEGTIPNFDESINGIVYCGTGKRSENASRILSEYGLKRVYNLIGGLKAWKEAGFQVIVTKNENCPCHQNSGELLSQGYSINVSQNPLILTIYPTDDTYVWSLYPNSNYGVYGPSGVVDPNALDPAGVLNDRFYVGGIDFLGIHTLRGLIKFEVPEIQNAQIVSATLKTTIYGHSLSFGGENVGVHKQDNTDWSENEVTWNTQPSFASEATYSTTEKTWDVTNDVTFGTTVGWTLKSDNESADEYEGFFTKEYDWLDHNISYRWPQLEIQYVGCIVVTVKYINDSLVPGATVTIIGTGVSGVTGSDGKVSFCGEAEINPNTTYTVSAIKSGLGSGSTLFITDGIGSASVTVTIS